MAHKIPAHGMRGSIDHSMAYLILSTDGQEWDRRELTGPAVLGRSADCEISVHDILLSRRHCRFTPMEDGWLVIDLGSRNGTSVGDHAIEERKLKHGDVLRVGKTKVTFRAEAFVLSSDRPKQRPALPPEIHYSDDTMAGSVVGMKLELHAVPARPPGRPSRPIPKPRPKDPDSFETEELYSMLEQIASSSWDSIYSVNAQPLRKNRAFPQPIIAGHSKPRPASPQVSLVLQASTMDRVVSARQIAPQRRRRFARLSRLIRRVRMLRLF